MTLPRRIQWDSLAELEQVCSWIYADEYDTNAKILAVNRMSAWRAITALPHALESTHALLTVILQDTAQQGSTSRLSLRQSYAAAIIRLVNGLVDPLQTRAYARSVASIAAQLGLPAWLVDLRHAATHEDLPSIEVLREAARESMAWLLHNYFLPTLNPTEPRPSQPVPLRPLAPLLKQYKALSKATVRDASLASRYNLDVTRILRDVERWVAEAKVAARGVRWDDGEEVDSRERWALDRLCDALLEKGALVPLAKKKRALSSASLTPVSTTLAIWTPLLTRLQALHRSLPFVLITRITAHLVSQDPSVEQAEARADMIKFDADLSVRDLSYDRCLAGWANWLVETYADESDVSAGLRREDVVISLVTALGPTRNDTGTETKGARDLLKALARGHPNLEKASALMSILPDAPPSAPWKDEDISVMHERLTSILTPPQASGATEAEDIDAQNVHDDAHPPPQGTQEDASADTALPRGWRRISEQDGWKPSPIGVFVPCAAA
ncbi:Las1-domain-containing protein [Wolfiporia cocos MD-104 SS10]|uniref:Las1-domain-containing protein n=1 Tax=Wolfiporia cocos (strain MD-104) TaxID=742152 RepID=A0A2H3IUA0_WOLCO|nr:Las1-domain-containing protein [Wolfiporia cocos MD-104 SS10]